MKKRYILIPVLILCVLTVGAAGFILSRNFLWSNDSRQTVAASTSQSPSEALSSKPSSSQTSSTAKTAIEKAFDLAPDVAGLTKQIQNLNGLDRVTYVDANKNVEGEYKYKDEVLMGGEKVGAVILKADMALKISNEQKAKLADTSKWLGVLPVDLSDMKTLDTVNIDISSEPLLVGGDYDIRISVGGNNTVSVVNTIPGETLFYQGLLQRNGFSTNISKFNRDAKSVIPGQESQFISSWAKFTGDPFSVNDKALNYGDKMGETLDPILENISCFNSAVLPNESFDNIAKINGCPIFVEANGK